MGTLATAAVGALFGIITGLSVQWWKSTRDELRILCDEFCSVIAISADIASEYWLVSSSSHEASMLEARVYGYQRRLSGYNVLIGRLLHDQAGNDIGDALARYFTVCTGGDFGAPSRQPSLDTAKLIQDRAGEVIMEVRSGYFDKVAVQEAIWRWISKMWPLRH